MKSKQETHAQEIKSLFLGPKAENQDLYENIIIEIIKDSCFLRKNFHPQDEVIITEKDKLSESFQLTAANLKQELQNILSELKRGVPLYHPRYIGHMHGDLLISAIAAYFGTILYNPNNIVGESSPATTRMEFEYISNLAQMVGYKPMKDADYKEDQSWGHLSAGGTTANMESLWVARNMKYYPIAVKIATLLETDCEYIGSIDISLIGKTVKEASFAELFGLSPNAIIKLKDDIITNTANSNNRKYAAIKKLIGKYEVINLGVYGIHNKVFELTNGKDVIELPRLYFPKSYHYSWDKAIDLIGIGREQIIQVPIDDCFRMDFEEFSKLYNKEKPTLAVIGVFGSSKQGSIDPIDDLVEFRNKLEKEYKKSFHLHIDGAYGGYLPCVIKNDDNTIISSQELVESLRFGNKTDLDFNINDKWLKKVDAIKYSDSITIDPHKMGYIPYPAGSIVFADTKCKDFISYIPSYLHKPENSKDISEEFIGQWTLEGSRPGAAAAACYLSNKILPYNKNAHGVIIKNTIKSAMLFYESIERFNKNQEINKGFKIVPAFVPESNIVSYVLSCPGKITEVNHLNHLTNRIYDKFSVKGDSVIPSINYMVAKEGFEIKDIKQTNILKECKLKRPENDNVEIKLLSSVFMNPMSVYVLEKEEDFYLNFWLEMVEYAELFKAEIMLKILSERGRKRIKVLWIEDEPEIDEINKKLQLESNIAQFLNVDFFMKPEEFQSAIKEDYDAYIFDLNLKDTNHHQFDADKIKLTISLIRQLIDKNGEEYLDRVLFYSKYVFDENIKELVKIELKKNHISPKSEQMIPKESIDKDIVNIVSGIFKIANKL